jgi:hypothetical protein
MFLKEWLKKRRVEKEKRWVALMEDQLKDPNTKAGHYALVFASRIAQGMAMRWMDDNRVRRCIHCPSFGKTLRTHKGQTFCQDHYPKEKVAV